MVAGLGRARAGVSDGEVFGARGVGDGERAGAGCDDFSGGAVLDGCDHRGGADG